MTEDLSKAEQDKIEEALAAGRKIDAVKLYREATGKGLKESKEAVEALGKELSARDPERFEKAVVSQKSGCVSMLMCCVAIAAAVLMLRSVLT